MFTSPVVHLKQVVEGILELLLPVHRHPPHVPPLVLQGGDTGAGGLHLIQLPRATVEVLLVAGCGQLGQALSILVLVGQVIMELL